MPTTLEPPLDGLTLNIIDETCSLHRATPECPDASDLEPFRAWPWWGVLWPGGWAVARFLRSRAGAALVRGADVVDFGSGCGVAALAAAQAGARWPVVANDIDATALRAVRINAALSGLDATRAVRCDPGRCARDAIGRLSADNWGTFFGGSDDDDDADDDGTSASDGRRPKVLLVGDVLYDADIAARLLPWLLALADGGGVRVLVGDPGRHVLSDAAPAPAPDAPTAAFLARKRRVASYALPAAMQREHHGFTAGHVWTVDPRRSSVQGSVPGRRFFSAAAAGAGAAGVEESDRGDGLRRFKFFGATVAVGERRREASGRADPDGSDVARPFHGPHDTAGGGSDGPPPVGLVVWTGALVLLRLFELGLLGDPHTALRGRRVVEVGAGTGLVGLALAAGAGARVCATDGDARVVELLRQNAGANGLLRDDGPLCSQVRGAQAQAQAVAPAGVDVDTLDWTAPDGFLRREAARRNGHDRSSCDDVADAVDAAPDWVVLSDVLYPDSRPTWPALARTLARLAPTRATDVVLAYEARNADHGGCSDHEEDEARFFGDGMAGRWFDCEEVSVPLGTALKANAVFEGLDTVGTSFWAPRSRQQAQSLRDVRVVRMRRKEGVAPPP